MFLSRSLMNVKNLRWTCTSIPSLILIRLVVLAKWWRTCQLVSGIWLLYHHSVKRKAKQNCVSVFSTVTLLSRVMEKNSATIFQIYLQTESQNNENWKEQFVINKCIFKWTLTWDNPLPLNHGFWLNGIGHIVTWFRHK